MSTFSKSPASPSPSAASGQRVHLAAAWRKARIVGLIGPNGSGKTTLFSSIVGFHPIDAGSIRFEGREISRTAVPEIARMGLLRTFQQTRIYGQDDLRGEHAHLAPPCAGAASPSSSGQHRRRRVERAEELLEFVGLFAKRNLMAGSLSFGQQKLLEFAMALMSEPQDADAGRAHRRHQSRLSSTG